MQTQIKHFIQQQHTVLPIINLDDSLHQADDILPIIDALHQGGIEAIEITLRSKIALHAIEIATSSFPNIQICIGSITTADQIKQLKQTGIRFIITPGINELLLNTCREYQLDILPGIMTPSDILLGIEHGLRYFKFFPAISSGGSAMLKSISAPFPNCQFCATGGITHDNASEFLAMNNVFSIASSAIADSKDIRTRNWGSITQKAQAFTSLTQL